MDGFSKKGKVTFQNFKVELVDAFLTGLQFRFSCTIFGVSGRC